MIYNQRKIQRDDCDFTIHTFLLAAYRSEVVGSSTGGAASSSAGGMLSEDTASIYARGIFEFVFGTILGCRIVDRLPYGIQTLVVQIVNSHPLKCIDVVVVVVVVVFSP